ncbi:hypothetical protein [Streptomyces sp. CNQ085]|uniref:hypothetical protein n=1 Tax=Streptomyces sp. CNQ085 TaxID=2886944 RepID=UPI001F512973|nr:hypothetical protein [Streptomyces sp. CNQ085]MCI0385812.1 hypothetical protein [Streptomyces sp. CNQ085]
MADDMSRARSRSAREPVEIDTSTPGIVHAYDATLYRADPAKHLAPPMTRPAAR